MLFQVWRVLTYPFVVLLRVHRNQGTDRELKAVTAVGLTFIAATFIVFQQAMWGYDELVTFFSSVVGMMHDAAVAAVKSIQG